MWKHRHPQPRRGRDRPVTGAFRSGQLRRETAGPGRSRPRCRSSRDTRRVKGHEESLGSRRPRGVEHGANPERRTWLEDRRREAEALGFTTQPYVVIVGGGQGGIALGARLRELEVPTIVVERNARPGDSWRKRYKSLCLHGPVWCDHLPYMKFAPNGQVFFPKDENADWLEMYTRVMELDYWGSTTAKRARYDEDAGEWALLVEREGEDITLRPKQRARTSPCGRSSW